jgi:uncharacterized protein (DUF427 family)
MAAIPHALKTAMADGHTITITPSTHHVVVKVDGAVVADTEHAMALDETGIPTRYYLPRDDVRTDLLTRTDAATTCPFKGQASYWSLDAGGKTYTDLVWSYETPLPNATGIAGLMCFYSERVETLLDGAPA